MPEVKTLGIVGFNRGGDGGFGKLRGRVVVIWSPVDEAVGRLGLVQR